MIEANCSRKQTVQVWCSTVEIKIITKQIKTTRSNKTIWKVLARHENQTVKYFRQLTLVICKKCSRILIIVARLLISALFSQTKGLSSSLLLKQTKNIVFVMWPKRDAWPCLRTEFCICPLLSSCELCTVPCVCRSPADSALPSQYPKECFSGHACFICNIWMNTKKYTYFLVHLPHPLSLCIHVY